MYHAGRFHEIEAENDRLKQENERLQRSVTTQLTTVELMETVDKKVTFLCEPDGARALGMALSEARNKHAECQAKIDDLVNYELLVGGERKVSFLVEPEGAKAIAEVIRDLEAEITRLKTPADATPATEPAP